MVTRFKLVFINRRVTPYRANTDDFLDIKIDLYNGAYKSYLNNILLEIYLNHLGYWTKVSEDYTNKLGSCLTSYPCSEIFGIDYCFGYAKTIINNKIYTSNIARFNFIDSGHPAIIECPEAIIQMEYGIFEI